MKNYLYIPIFAMLFVSCAEYTPIIDMQGIDRVKYEQDLADCRGYSSQVQDNTMRNALIGAGIGAALGGVSGGSRNTVGTAAGIGAIGGGVSGKGKQVNEREKVLKNCLRGRGYELLN